MTGERVSRSVRETPSSVAVFTSDMIETQAGADRLEQILELVPNVVLGTGSRGPTIRGQDTTGSLQDLPAFLGGTRPRVTLQVDGRAVGFNEFVFGVAPLWDVDQIEVFRSPQSTTQGRNSIAGAIFINTKDPTYQWEAGARAIASDQHGRQLSGVVSGPLIADQLAFRIAGDLSLGRTSARITDRMPGADPNEDNFGLIRFKLLGEPEIIPGARLEGTYTHTESDLGGDNIRAPFHDRRDTFPLYGVFSTNIDTLTGSWVQELRGTFKIATTFSHGDGRIKRFPPPGLGRTDTSTSDYSVESIADWRPDQSVRLIGGIHHLWSRLHQLIDLSAVVGLGEFDDHQRSLGLFGEAIFKPWPRVAITSGLRYQRDSQRRKGQLGKPDFLLPVDFDETFDAWLPKLSVSYELTPDITAGALVQRAYTPGGTTLNFDTGQQELFGPETLWSYEAFARANLADHRVSLSANLFYNDYRDAQRSNFHGFSVPGGGTAFWAEIENLPKARTHGLEASVDWRASNRLNIAAGLGLLSSKISKPAPSRPLLEGNQFSRAPAWTASASFDWTPVNRLRLNGTFRHTSSYFSDDANSPLLEVGPATRIDARAAFDTGPVTVFGYVRNLLDQFDMTYLLSAASGTAAEPRELGIGLEAHF